ncbi:MAG TPA: prolyl oligopeptidase family serine peptidase [Terriglobales bacterium]|nr:prolyl oligopeptidase family serine peptidase [Terriglobales bacterium]
MRKPPRSLCVVAVLLLSLPLFAADAAAPSRPKYQKPASMITGILESQAMPSISVSPTRDRMIVIDSLRHPPIADLAQPMMRLAGLRFNPATNGPHHPVRRNGYRLITIADGKQTKVSLPPNAWVSEPEWSADGRHFAFLNFTAASVELWIGDAFSGTTRRMQNVKLNAVYGEPFQWMPDQRTILVQLVSSTRGPEPPAPKAPSGPNVQESSGKPAPIRTYEDLLTNPHEEDLFDYYATAQLALVDTHTGKITPVGKPAIFESVSPSPDGQHILVSRVVKPYSYQMPVFDFPHEVEVWDRTGKVEQHLASQPSAEHVPIEGVITGPRSHEWVATRPATLLWTVALDEGNPKKKADFRDQLYLLSAPFTGKPTEFTRLRYRFAGGRIGGVSYGENGLLVVRDYDRNRRWVRTLAVNVDKSADAPKVLWERSINDRYGDPGTPVTRVLPNGQLVMLQIGDDIFLRGEGASPKGDFPFLDRYNLATGKSERLFRASEQTYESPIAILTTDGSKFLTRFETPDTAPIYYIRHSANPDAKTPVFTTPNPAPQLSLITKQLVTYKRPDGVDLSFTLYLPPSCASQLPAGMACRKLGERLPSVIWAYPLEYTDARTAGQVSGSQYRFTTINGMSHLWLVTQGYAVLDNATMPVVGDPETMNNTYIEQIAASAKAAIDKAAEMGVSDPNRFGAMGHSYGAFMTANLLAHTDLFKAGVARSGAYNRTLTPFGFQSERRTYWEAQDTYNRMSPFNYAHKIKRPILLIHGEADDNSGTFPIQSERLYAAIKGNGGTVRYVTLPHEAHGYQAIESVEHTLFETINWFDKWVKNVPADSSAGTPAN